MQAADKKADNAQRDRLKNQFNLGVADCPVFPNIFDYCQSYAGASIGAAVQLNYGHADICINWAGGLHHARKCKVSCRLVCCCAVPSWLIPPYLFDEIFVCRL